MRLSNPARAAKCRAPMTPAAGTALDDARGILRDGAGVEDAAARLHHHQPAADAGTPGPRDQGPHVFLHRRADVGVDDGGGGALVLQLPGQHVHRQRDERVRQHLAQNLAGAPLVGGVGIGVQVADRDRFDTGGADALGRGADSRFVEGAEHFAARTGPLVDLEPMLPRHERGWTLVERLVEVRNPDPPELQHVAKAARGEQRGRRALAFEDCVCRHRASMQQLFERDGRRAELSEQVAHSGDHRVRVVVRGGRELSGGEPTIRREHGNVGEGPADVGGGASDGWRD